MMKKKNVALLLFQNLGNSLISMNLDQSLFVAVCQVSDFNQKLHLDWMASLFSVFKNGLNLTDPYLMKLGCLFFFLKSIILSIPKTLRDLFILVLVFLEHIHCCLVLLHLILQMSFLQSVSQILHNHQFLRVLHSSNRDHYNCLLTGLDTLLSQTHHRFLQ